MPLGKCAIDFAKPELAGFSPLALMMPVRSIFTQEAGTWASCLDADNLAADPSWSDGFIHIFVRLAAGDKTRQTVGHRYGYGPSPRFS